MGREEREDVPEDSVTSKRTKGVIREKGFKSNTEDEGDYTGENGEGEVVGWFLCSRRPESWG